MTHNYNHKHNKCSIGWFWLYDHTVCQNLIMEHHFHVFIVKASPQRLPLKHLKFSKIFWMMNSWPYRLHKNSLEPKLVYHNTRGLNLSQPNRNTKQIRDAVVNNHKCHKPVSMDELCVYELCCALIKSTANQYKPMSQCCLNDVQGCWSDVANVYRRV